MCYHAEHLLGHLTPLVLNSGVGDCGAPFIHASILRFLLLRSCTAHAAPLYCGVASSEACIHWRGRDLQSTSRAWHAQFYTTRLVFAAHCGLVLQRLACRS